MRRLTRRSLIGAVAAIGLSAAAIPVVLPAAADPVDAPAGTLTLATGATDEVRLAGAGVVGLEDRTQPLSTSGTCNLASDGSLLAFTGAVGSTSRPVGFRTDSIGVIESSLTSLCNRVDVVSFSNTESLTLSLGSALKSFDGSPLRATRASLDIEVRSWLGSRAQIQATARSAGTTVGTFSLAQGSSTCNVGDGGNCRWEFDVAGGFDTLVLRAVKGSFSLEGGSDTGTTTPAPSTGPTTFDLVATVDAVVACTPGSELTDGTSTVVYVGTSDEECAEFGATLTSTDSEVRLLKPLNVNPGAQFIVTIPWKPALPAVGDEALTLPALEVDFELPGGVGRQDLALCPPTLYRENGSFKAFGEGEQEGELLVVATTGLPDQEPSTDTLEFACIATRSAELSGASSTSSVEDAIFLVGDVRFSKP